MNPDSSRCVISEKADGVATLVVNRPDQRNALSLEVVETLTSLLDELERDESVRVVATTGAGDTAYIAGLDVHDLATIWRDEASAPHGKYVRLVETLRSFPKPTIAVLGGYCLGGAVTVLLAHDLVIASDRAEIGLPEVFRGFTPRYVVGALFKSGVPIKYAMEMLLTGKNFDARKAEQVGLVNRVVPHERLREEALNWARELARLDPLTLSYCKKAALACMDQPTFGQALAVSELVHVQHNVVNPRGFEGLIAFIEKRGERASGRRNAV